jgi:hypothetical protein
MSYSPVYSAAFVEYTDASPNTSFEVPSGYTAIVRQFSVYAELAAVNVQLASQDSETGTYVVLAAAVLASFPAQQQLYGRWVVPEGLTIALLGGEVGTGLNVYIGGYLLTNVVS